MGVKVQPRGKSTPAAEDAVSGRVSAALGRWAARDYPWILKTKRVDKLRDALKEVEDLMQNTPCVLSKWKNKHTCQVQCHQKVLQCSVGGAEQPFSDGSSSVKMLTQKITGVFLICGPLLNS
ncbi:hypothetical protein EK904_006940 [Melospiza melodia maxima]|nr:hypothetical protein EK904_006940 [Melospiza melodia maxima]